MSDRNMMGFCPSIKTVDSTLRDGGYVNNFNFTDEFVQDLYTSLAAAGVDYMEFGYLGGREMCNLADSGRWKFCDDAKIRSVIEKTGLRPVKIAVMADAGRSDCDNELPPKDESVIDLVRVSCYINQIPMALDMVKTAKAKGYEVSCNLMTVSKVRENDLAASLKMLAQSPVDTVYIEDSFGNYYPEQIVELAGKYLEILSPTGKKLGFHGYNSQQLAFANTIECCRVGADYLDATVAGIGRGAGNCTLESLLCFLKNPKYDVVPVLDFITKHVIPLKNSGASWGCDVPYILSGMMNTNPSSAAKFIREGRTDYSRFMQELMEIV